MSERSAIVIGAGVGGLACAIDLAARGIAVSVFERMPQAGGKMREVEIEGQRIDAGPTVFTMRWVFDELFERAGARWDSAVVLQPAQTLARHAWRAGETLDLYGDIARTTDAIGRFAGPAEGARYRRFCERAERVYHSLDRTYLRASRPTPWSLLTRAGVAGLPDMLRISPFQTLWVALGEHFHDPRLRQLFGRYATYCGSSPFLAPATLMLIAHVERDGVWRVHGGMQKIAEALASLALKLGVRLRYGTHVERVVVEKARACGVVLDCGERIDADTVVFNGDVAALGDGLLGADVASAVGMMRSKRRSLSAITWNMLARTDGFPLAHHNVFFGSDSRREFDDLFARSQVPSDPTVYVCAQDRNEPDSQEAKAEERLLCLINAPATGDSAPLHSQELAQCEQRMLQRLRTCGLSVQTTPTLSRRTTPTEFAQMFPASGAHSTARRRTVGWRRFADRVRARALRDCIWRAARRTRGRACRWQRYRDGRRR